MPDSWWPQPFPIREEDVLVVAWGFPGFAADLTHWELRIADDGLLVQYVDVWLPGGKKQFEDYISELPEKFCDTLRDKANQIGFERFSERYSTTWDDLPSWHIEFRLADGTRKKVDVECDPNRIGQEAIDVDLFFELWKMIHLHAAYPKPERSKRQLKMDARRQRRSDGKTERHESGPLDSQEGK